MIHRIRRPARALSLLALAASCPAFVLAQTPSPAVLSGKVLPSFVELTVQLTDGRTALGSGFLAVKDGALATAWQLVAQARAVVAKFPNGEEFECSGVIDKDARRNIALVRIKVFGRPVLRMEPVDLPPGTPVLVPAVKDGAFGLVAVSVGEPSVLDGVKQVRLEGDVPGTANGAPVVDAAGNVIGIAGTRNVDGKLAAFSIPVAYLLGLDPSLPTQPWGAAAPPTSTAAARGAAPASAPNMMPLDEVDARIGRALFAVTNQRVAQSMGESYAGDMGFLSGVPDFVYRAQQDMDAAAGALKEILTDNELRQKIGRASLKMMDDLKTASEHFIRAVVIGQQVKSWDAQSQDAVKRSYVLIDAVTQQLDALKTDLESLAEASARFREFLPLGQKYALRLLKRHSGFGIGTYAYPREPFRIAHTPYGSFAYKMGLRPGDMIVAAAGRTFAPEDDFEEFKLIIKAHLGKILPVEVERDGQRQTIKLKVLKEIPADAWYKD
ncbi:MAG: hypothetical protein MUE80_01920 [Acidobacteria bacterium]|nr:hypothetical protein [Acidobacteriota bacterium]